MTNKLITANELRRHLIDDEGWTPHEVRDFLLAGGNSADRTEDEWLDAIHEWINR